MKMVAVRPAREAVGPVEAMEAGGAMAATKVTVTVGRTAPAPGASGQEVKKAEEELEELEVLEEWQGLEEPATREVA